MDAHEEMTTQEFHRLQGKADSALITITCFVVIGLVCGIELLIHLLRHLASLFV